MTDLPDETYFDAVAAALGLPVERIDRADVTAQMRAIFSRTEALMTLDLGETVESPAVFRP